MKSPSSTSKTLIRFSLIFLVIITISVFYLFHATFAPTHDNENLRFPTKPQEIISPSTTTMTTQSHASIESVENLINRKTIQSPKLVWNRNVYLPAPTKSIEAFKKHEEKQRLRLQQQQQPNARDTFLWTKIKPNSSDETICLQFTPECEFFRIIATAILFDKCCAEHRKLKEALSYTVQAIQYYNKNNNDNDQKLELFLDSGTLLSFLRDGGDTLVPWETDIDLGIIGAWPGKIDQIFKSFQKQVPPPSLNKNSLSSSTKNNYYIFKNHHYFESCKRKQSANKSRDGTCSDAFYVYFAKSAERAAIDTSRVEIWPFREDGELLVHPTRPKKLNVPRNMVLPFTDCGGRKGKDFWGIEGASEILRCPHKSEAYLDNEYGKTWKWPKTIHWGQNNAPAWNEPSGTK